MAEYTDPIDLVGLLKRDWGHQYDALPRIAADTEDGFFLENQMFGSVDAELLYGMVRHVKPKRIVEVGAGWTTLLVLKAIEDMREDDEKVIPMFESVDPRAPGFVYHREGVHINTKRLQEMNILNTLKPGDMLLCDTSHVWIEGHEVDVIIKKLPDLKGVFVHFHDIFLPDDYPAQWSDRGYTEQHVLAAFLKANPEWKVLLDANRIHKEIPDAFKGAIASYDPDRPIGPGSFWIMADAPKPARKRTPKRPPKKRVG